MALTILGSAILNNLLPFVVIKFSSADAFTLATANSTKNWDGKLEYSYNCSTWNEWTGTTTLSSQNNLLYLRGTDNTHITGNDVEDANFVLTGSEISCTGNIESLLDYQTVLANGHPAMGSYCYYELFKGCTSLTQAPTLPATTLAECCYNYMFSNCTSLSMPPELPATDLAHSCYAYMFNGCTSLVQAPELPAMNLAINCYWGMFYDCTSLTQAPELPAESLEWNCYRYMFSGCTSLEQTPELPASLLVDTCYAHMFERCTSLSTLPNLLAVELTDSCYYEMFSGCTNIKLSETQVGEYQTAYRIPTSGEGSMVTFALDNMFANTGGTFTGTPEINRTYYTSNTII